MCPSAIGSHGDTICWWNAADHNNEYNSMVHLIGCTPDVFFHVPYSGNDDSPFFGYDYGVCERDEVRCVCVRACVCVCDNVEECGLCSLNKGWRLCMTIMMVMMVIAPRGLPPPSFSSHAVPHHAVWIVFVVVQHSVWALHAAGHNAVSHTHIDTMHSPVSHVWPHDLFRILFLKLYVSSKHVPPYAVALYVFSHMLVSMRPDSSRSSSDE